jgi:Fungal chitosanase of glycosyl hydrolase group 75
MADVEKIGKVGESFIRQFSSDSSVFFFRAGMAVDADGSPRAYHPEKGKGLDWLGNAGNEEEGWWALVTDKKGSPVVQGDADPAPGFYISTTTLENQSKPETDPSRYVDSETIPFFVLPGNQLFGAKLGDFDFVVNPTNGKSCGCIFADTGPGDEIGEGSIALAKALGINANPKNGGANDGLAYIVFPGSGPGWPSSADEINKKATKLFENWGGMEKIKKGLPRLTW